jgi:hypothetical protein
MRALASVAADEIAELAESPPANAAESPLETFDESLDIDGAEIRFAVNPQHDKRHGIFPVPFEVLQKFRDGHFFAAHS